MIKKFLLVVLSVGVIAAAGLGYGLMQKETTTPSDVNSDGEVNLQDVSIVLSNMQSTTTVIESAE